MPYALSFQRFNFTWTGDWLDGSIYQIGDAAESGGSAYVCVQPHVASGSNGPPNAAFWELMVSKGDQGLTGPAGPMPPVVQLGADQTRSLNTLANVPGLAVPVDANKDYYVEMAIIFRSAAAGNGIELAVNGPASPTSVSSTYVIPSSASAAVFGHSRAYDVGAQSSGVDVINADFMATVLCLFRNGPNAGNLVLRFASENNGQLVTVKAGSTIRYHQLN